MPAGRKLKVGFVVHEFGRYKNHGGIAAVYWDLLTQLAEDQTLDLHVITTQDKLVKPPRGVTLHRIRPKGLDHFADIADLLDSLDLDWVEAADAYALASGFLVRRSLGTTTSRPHVEVSHHTGHREIWEWGSGMSIEVAPAYFRAMAGLEQVQAELADTNTAPSQFLADYLKPRVPNREIDVQRFPTTDIDAVDLWGAWDPGKANRILSLGRWESRKRQLDLVAAAQSVGGDLEVHFVGNSIADFESGIDYRSFVYSQIPRAERSRFRFYDFATPSEASLQYRRAGWFCISSPKENFPTTAIEALARGLPVIGSIDSGVADFSGEVPDVLFDPSDRDGLARTLRYAVGLNDDSRRSVWRAQADVARRLLSRRVTVDDRLARYRSTRSSMIEPDFKSGSAVRPKVVLLLPAGSRQPSPVDFARGWELRVCATQEIADPLLGWADYAVTFHQTPDSAALEGLHELIQIVHANGLAQQGYALHPSGAGYFDTIRMAWEGTIPGIILPCADVVAEDYATWIDFLASNLVSRAPLRPVVDARYSIGGAPETLVTRLRHLLSTDSPSD